MEMESKTMTHINQHEKKKIKTNFDVGSIFEGFVDQTVRQIGLASELWVAAGALQGCSGLFQACC